MDAPGGRARRSSRHRRRRQSASNGRSRSSATSPAGGPPPPDPAADSKVSATHEAGASEDAQADECAQDPCGSGLATGALPSDRPTAGKDESPHSPSGSSTEPTADEAPCATPVASGAPSAEDGPSTQDTVRQPKLEAAVDRVVGVEAALRGLRELVGEDTGASMRAPAVRLAQVRAEFFWQQTALHCSAQPMFFSTHISSTIFLFEARGADQCSQGFGLPVVGSEDRNS